eukprot:330583-Pelagomonas_calceolata.AAC.2
MSKAKSAGREAIRNISKSPVGRIGKKAADGIGKAMEKTTDRIEEIERKARDGIGKAREKTTDEIKRVGRKATDGIGKATEKTTDGIKRVRRKYHSKAARKSTCAHSILLATHQKSCSGRSEASSSTIWMQNHMSKEHWHA